MPHFRFYLGLAATLITASLTSTYAAESVSLQHTPFSDVKQLFQVQAPGLVQSSNDTRKNSLYFLRQHRDQKRVLHTRMQQYYSGIPVFGGYAILHSKGSARQMFQSSASPISMNGVVYKGLTDDLGSLPLEYINKGQDALQAFKAQFSSQVLSDGDVRPIIYIDKNKRAHWAYQVNVLITYDDKIPERPTAIVDAETFQTYVKWNQIKQVRALAKGLGFGGNQRVGLYQFGKTLPLLDIMRDDDSGKCYMENTVVRVVNMVHRYMGFNTTMRFNCPKERQQSDGSYLMGAQGNGYDRINGAYSPSNDALYAGGVIADMYKKWYDMNVLEEDNNKPMKLLMRVHFGLAFQNAFWDGEQMTFGDGGILFYPLVSLGIAAHEISHGFTEQHSDLEYFYQSGAMNESFSDMAAQTAEYYSTGKASWRIGAEVIKEGFGIDAFRYMDMPSRDGTSIDRADQYNDDLDVHYSSGVYNRLFYLLATQPNWDVRKAFQVMLTANADYWIPTSTFDEAACGIIEATKQFDFSVADVKSVLDQVAVNYSACL